MTDEKQRQIIYNTKNKIKFVWRMNFVEDAFFMADAWAYCLCIFQRKNCNFSTKKTSECIIFSSNVFTTSRGRGSLSEKWSENCWNWSKLMDVWKRYKNRSARAVPIRKVVCRDRYHCVEKKSVKPSSIVFGNYCYWRIHKFESFE